MTRTEQLNRELKQIAAAHKSEIDALPLRGVKGGSNAKNIKGWTRSTANITRAGGLPMLSWWDGCAPTPSTGIPTCCAQEAYAAERKIFG